MLNKLLHETHLVFPRMKAGLSSAVAKNVASLYVIQFANYVVPLIMIPYLVRVLGPAEYGTVAFGQGLINYLMLFVEYGFDWSATRRISVERDNLQAVNRIALHVWIAKGLLSLVALIVLLFLIYLVPNLREVSLILIALYGLVLGNALFPTWLFQGLERMVAISIINLAMKLVILGGVFALVRRPDHAIWYAVMLGGGAVTAGLVGMAVSVRMFHLRIVKVFGVDIIDVLKEGWTLFLSKASVSLYTAGNAFILGMLTNHTVVGYYSAAEKLVYTSQRLWEPITQAVYPRSSKIATESTNSLLHWARKGLFIQVSLGTIMSVILFVFAHPITSFIFGPEYFTAEFLIQILAIVPFLASISSGLGRFVLLPLRKDKPRLVILIIAGILNLALAFLLVPIWSGTGMAISVALSETFITALYWIYLSKIHLNPLFSPLL